MGHSDDEEDFLSADEGDEDDEDSQPLKADLKHSSQPVVKTYPKEEDNSSNTPSRRSQDGESALIISNSINDESNVSAETTGSSSNTSSCKQDITSLSTSNEDEDEDAVAERIRERNLQIARKFSAEIAKNVKASAPIPMITNQSQFEANLNTIDVEASISGSDSSSKGSLPPAPPPTPALSSSLNTDDLLSNIASQDTSKYGWRVPAAVGAVSESKLAQPVPSSSSKSEQARIALDRLSERLAQTENNKNLFERVAEDIKKVTLNRDSQEGGGIPSISDIGNSLGAFGWNSASKFFSSATEVTSRVGTSVLDSVVSVTQQATRSLEQTTNFSPNQKDALNDERKIQ